MKEALPEWMQEKVIEWVRSLQSPDDGYFYHPQWGKNIKLTRLNRDQTWATRIFQMFGGMPKWDMPYGTRGEYGRAPGITAMTGPLTQSATPVAASKVIPTAYDRPEQFPERLQTMENLIKYLACDINGNTDPTDLTPNRIRTNSYDIGENIGASLSLAQQRDALAVAMGELEDIDSDGDGYIDGGYVDTIKTTFNSWQLPNGLWEYNKSIDPETGKPVDDPEGGVPYYNALNGLMKISGFYNGAYIEMPNAEAAFNSAIYMINYINETDGKPGADIMGKKPTNSVDIYNPWVCVVSILTNVERTGNTETVERFRQILKENAAEMIKNTTAKTIYFKKDDGSFGYTWSAVPATSQGADVAVPGTIEGDVNGGCISVTGITKYMLMAFGMDIPIFRDSDWDVCLDIFEKSSPVIKDSVFIDEAEVVDFDGYDEGAPASEIEEILSSAMNTGSLSIVGAPPSDKGYAGGRALQFVAAAKGNGDTVTFGAGGAGTTCYVLEFDFFMKEYNMNTTLFQITLGSCYRLTMVSSGGVIRLGDDSVNAGGTGRVTQDFGVTFTVGEWHRIRVEYYPGSAENVVTKIYLDEELRAVSHNYYYDKTDSPVPSAKYNDAGFYSLYSCIQTVYLDNILVERSDTPYVEEEIVYPD